MKRTNNHMCEELMEAFERRYSELYWLAFLITGDADKSVDAFGRALDFDEAAGPISSGSMNDWARKLTIVEALRGIQKELRTSMLRVLEDEVPANLRWARIEREQFEEAVMAIDSFPRCAMLLTIFEGISIDSAAALLHADEPLTRKGQQIGIVRLTANLASACYLNPGRGRIAIPVRSLS